MYLEGAWRLARNGFKLHKRRGAATGVPLGRTRTLRLPPPGPAPPSNLERYTERCPSVCGCA